ncbi:DUF6268 family outer membrane beta-barrel protein [Croceiramulus getboli]|nr:DUF6268 family outer membrane beta-barrel protein [Flavobacteriaceae bacterium YJPT1-3]
MIKKPLLVVLLCCIPFPAIAQLTDLARVEYTYFPQSDSDNSFRRFRALANIPLVMGWEGHYLVPGIEYRNVNLQYEDMAPFLRQGLDRFQSIDVSLGYTFPLKNNWRFGARAGVIIASNFVRDRAISDDLLFDGGLYFVKDKTEEGLEKPWRLVLGVTYNTDAGRPFPLPYVNFNKTLNEHWSYTLGAPKTNVKYYFTQKHIVQAFVTLDGFYANIQEGREIPQPDDSSLFADNISMTVVLSGVGYEHYFTKNLLAYVYAGWTLANEIRLRNNEREDVFIINETNTFYTRGGLKFKI